MVVHGCHWLNAVYKDTTSLPDFIRCCKDIPQLVWAWTSVCHACLFVLLAVKNSFLVFLSAVFYLLQINAATLILFFLRILWEVVVTPKSNVHLQNGVCLIPVRHPDRFHVIKVVRDKANDCAADSNEKRYFSTEMQLQLELEIRNTHLVSFCKVFSVRFWKRKWQLPLGSALFWHLELITSFANTQFRCSSVDSAFTDSVRQWLHLTRDPGTRWNVIRGNTSSLVLMSKPETTNCHVNFNLLSHQQEKTSTKCL